MGEGTSGTNGIRKTKKKKKKHCPASRSDHLDNGGQVVAESPRPPRKAKKKSLASRSSREDRYPPDETTTSRLTPKPPRGIPENVAGGALQAFWKEFVDEEEDSIMDFFDENDVADEIEDLLAPHLDKILKAGDKSEAIDALARKWGFASPGELISAKKKRKVSKFKAREDDSGAVGQDARSKQDVCSRGAKPNKKGKKRMGKRRGGPQEEIETCVDASASDEDALDVGGLKLHQKRKKSKTRC